MLNRSIYSHDLIEFANHIRQQAPNLVGDAANDGLEQLIQAAQELQSANNLLFAMSEIIKIIQQGKSVAEHHLDRINQYFNLENAYVLVRAAVRQDDVETLSWLVNTLNYPLSPLNYDWKKDCQQQIPNIIDEERDQGYVSHEESYSTHTLAQEHFNYKSAFLLAADLECMKAIEWILDSQTVSKDEYKRAICMCSNRNLLFNALFRDIVKRDDDVLFESLYRNYSEKVNLSNVANDLNHNQNLKIVKWIDSYNQQLAQEHERELRKLARREKRKADSVTQFGHFARDDIVTIVDFRGVKYEAKIRKVKQP